MHRIISSHLKTFTKSLGLECLPQDEQFENFSNFSILYSRCPSGFELEDVTTGAGDDGIDGLAIIIDEELVISDEDAKSAFSKDKKNHDVEAVFIQSKTTDSFDLGDFLKFKEAVIRFITEEHYTAPDSIQQNARAIFDECIRNVPKIRNGKPNLTARFVTTGNYLSPKEFKLAIEKFHQQLTEIGYFHHIDIKCIDRNELTNLWISTYSGISAQLTLFGSAPLPTISGVEEAYLVVAQAEQVVKNLLVAEDGSLRSQVFEENVRAYLGNDNAVNQSIAETLNDKNTSSRFPVLNNGITIVSPDVRLQGNILHLDNFQIVNGCQTSNILYENLGKYDSGVMVTLKIIETSNEDVFSELVRATNSQSKVDETQFLTLRPIVKRVEQYFNSFEGLDGRLYFERREKQFFGKEVPVIRTFNINTVAKCMTSMFLERPDLAYRYPKRMYETLSDTIFHDENKEIPFYASCLTLYRLHLHVASGAIPQNMRKFKWHILVLVRALIAGKEMPSLKSKKIDTYCQKIIDKLAKPGEQSVTPFKQAVDILNSIGPISDDRLKRQSVLDDMLAKVSQTALKQTT
ncbi:AIPR family protein [Pseudomonas sp. L-22-4S-12]|uniref:AIPR family protein n=1 Tax=Pseudomonas sp. L-22-4S-12 TaxID=2610893 RepID=UPI0013275905|nr:AIPR family protein [Pseudomonas sp. L-22-4S-12]MWV15670.1 AIPR family protein [Pseudomonas sp. L-22-4S-12]